MKVKISLIPFIPVVIAMIGLKLMSLFGLDSNGMFMGMNKMGIAYTVIGFALGLFAVCVLINIFDRKTSPVYPVKKNIFSGILGILSGASVIASSVVSFINTGSESEYYLMMLICAAISIPAGIALVLMSKVHFTGKSTVSGISMLYIFPALWGCSELVSEFLVATKVSISASDMTALFCYIFITLYFFSHSMIVSRIKGRNPVKACFIYGLPAVALSVTFGLYTACTSMVEGFDISKIVLGIELAIISLYMLSFIVEMAFNSYTKDEIEIIDSLPSDDDTYEKSYVQTGGYDELVFAEKSTDESTESESDVKEDPERFSEIPGLDDFIIGFGEDVNPEPIKYVSETDKIEEVELESVEIPEEKEMPAVVDDEIVPFAAVIEQPSKPDIRPSAAVNEPEEEKLSDIDLLLQELESKK